MYSRPGRGVYVTADKSITHGAAAKQSNLVGVAVKQVNVPLTSGLAAQNVIVSGERYFLITKGEIEVADPGLSSPAIGDAVYITDADNVITKSSGAGKTALGRITAISTSGRGVSTGRVRIDLDAKDSI